MYSYLVCNFLVHVFSVPEASVMLRIFQIRYLLMAINMIVLKSCEYQLKKNFQNDCALPAVFYCYQLLQTGWRIIQNPLIIRMPDGVENDQSQTQTVGRNSKLYRIL